MQLIERDELSFNALHISRSVLLVCCALEFRMKDVKGVDRGACMKPGCSCEEYIKERDFNLCSYCEHTPLSHGNYTCTF